jgi:hypothetical protein
MTGTVPVKRLMTIGEIILNEEVRRTKRRWIAGLLIMCLTLTATISTVAILVYSYIQQGSLAILS